jgi:hypothetical protein
MQIVAESYEHDLCGPFPRREEGREGSDELFEILKAYGFASA